MKKYLKLITATALFTLLSSLMLCAEKFEVEDHDADGHYDSSEVISAMHKQMPRADRFSNYGEGYEEFNYKSEIDL